MIFSFFALRFRQLVVLELSSFLPFRACFGLECLGEPVPSKINSYYRRTCSQYILVERPVIPIFEHELVAAAH